MVVEHSQAGCGDWHAVGTGSGKSSILATLLGEMHKLAGAVTVRGRVGYAPQHRKQPRGLGGVRMGVW